MQHSLFVADAAVMVGMLVLASLSQRLGDALKIPPYYRFLYIATALVLMAFALDSFRESLQVSLLDLVAMSLRAAGVIVGGAACLPYWRWVFAEYIGKGR